MLISILSLPLLSLPNFRQPFFFTPPGPLPLLWELSELRVCVRFGIMAAWNISPPCCYWPIIPFSTSLKGPNVADNLPVQGRNWKEMKGGCGLLSSLFIMLGSRVRVETNEKHQQFLFFGLAISHDNLFSPSRTDFSYPYSFAYSPLHHVTYPIPPVMF